MSQFEQSPSAPETTTTTPENGTPVAPIFGGNATETPTISFDDYFNSIPEDKRTVLSKNGVKDTDTLLSSYEGLLSLKGKKGFKPDENASQEEKDAYRQNIYKEIGVPENGEYNFVTPEGVNPEIISDDFVNGLASVAHEKGVSQEAFQSVLDTIYPAYQQEIMGYQEEIQALKAKLGEGTMNPTGESQAAQPVDVEAQAQKLMKEYTHAFQNNDFETYNKKMSEFNRLRGY